MTKFTKADIDGLVDGMCPRVDYLVEIAGSSLFSGDVRRAMYKAAGLTASGERKPERVRCWLYRMKGQSDPRGISIGPIPAPGIDGAWEHIPGTFVPDGAA